jgi:quinol monooxygenase YgiN
MSIHLIAAFAGCIVAATGTGMLVMRLRRPPRLVVAFCALALLGLAASLGAQALGYHNGFGPLTFRAMELGAQVVAPLALGLALAEVAGRTLAARFIVRLTLPALALIALVVLGTDPLSGTRFSGAWPDPAVYYQIIPNKLIEYGLAPATALVAFIAIGCTAMRTGQNPAWRPAVVPAWAAGLAAFALALPGLSVLMGVHLPVNWQFLLLCLAATVLTWIAGLRVGRVRLHQLRTAAHEGAGRQIGGGYTEDGEDWQEPDTWEARYPEMADFAAADGEGADRSNGQHLPDESFLPDAAYPPGDGYRPDGGHPLDEHPAHDGHRSHAGNPVPGDGHRPGGAGYQGEIGYDPSHSDPGLGAGAQADSWTADTAALAPQPDGLPPAGDRDAREQLFGQIAIYTLMEGRVEEFDRLIQQVVELVRAREHDTLVYIVHAVPSAPMQRILYEVYRDRAGYDQHNRQPYIARFEADRAPLVLATNVIELGLQQAKVSPFPSLDDLFPEAGYDTSGFERPDYSRYGSPAAGSGDVPGFSR